MTQNLAQTSPVHSGLVAYLGVVGHNGGTTTYTAPCALEDRSMALEKTTTEETIPDCDGALPGVVESEVEAMIMRLSGSGLMAEQSIDAWDEAYESVDPVPVRVDVIKASGAIIRRECLMHFTSFTYSGASDKAKVRIAVEGTSHGAIARETIAAPT